ncbi:MAG: OmpA family protein [Firmicutes bacterium]|nr:OmpA family protein [Bacillota bacterium]
MSGNPKGGKSQPIIIKKVKKGGHGGHHGGAWKVAYADFVTAMMALFIVLWIVGQSEKVKVAISMYFKDPEKFEEKVKDGTIVLPVSTGTPSPMPSGNLMLMKTEKDDTEQLKKEAENLEKMVTSDPDLKKFKDQIEIKITDEGLRIELFEKSSGNGVYFDLSSAKLKPEAEKLLNKLAGELKKLPNDISVEGHTDARQFITQTYTNWELSADRANAARRILLNGGIAKKQLSEIRGYADQKLRNPDSPNDFSNRRVSILLKKRIVKEDKPDDKQEKKPEGSASPAASGAPAEAPAAPAGEHGGAPAEAPAGGHGEAPAAPAGGHGEAPAAPAGGHGEAPAAPAGEMPPPPPPEAPAAPAAPPAGGH